MPVITLLGVGGSGRIPPFILSATIDITGLVLTIVFDRPVTQGVGLPTVTADGNPITLTYTSGSGTDTWIYAITNGH